jgi:hypothetical protein
MIPEQERLTLEILSKLDTFFTLDGIRQCQYCGGHSHEEDCIVRPIRQLKRTMEQEQEKKD